MFEGTACSVIFQVSVKKTTGVFGMIRTHDLLLTRADVLTSRPPSLPDDDWPARIFIEAGPTICTD